jgi:hypothetical protein
MVGGLRYARARPKPLCGRCRSIRAWRRWWSADARAAKMVTSLRDWRSWRGLCPQGCKGAETPMPPKELRAGSLRPSVLSLRVSVVYVKEGRGDLGLEGANWQRRAWPTCLPDGRYWDYCGRGTDSGVGRALPLITRSGPSAIKRGETSRSKLNAKQRRMIGERDAGEAAAALARGGRGDDLACAKCRLR